MSFSHNKERERNVTEKENQTMKTKNTNQNKEELRNPKNEENKNVDKAINEILNTPKPNDSELQKQVEELKRQFKAN